MNIDQAYWQIVSIAAKKELAANYFDILKTIEHDGQVSADEGAATQGDVLLADEGCGELAAPLARTSVSMEEITARRPELRSLNLASQIYDEKVKVARADMLPQIALTGNYFLTNPSISKGFQKDFRGFFAAGVSVKVPIFHGLETLKKTQKAKLEAELYRSKYDDSITLVNLELSQLHAQRDEAQERLQMAKSNLDSAEENLRAATIGFEEGGGNPMWPWQPSRHGFRPTLNTLMPASSF